MLARVLSPVSFTILIDLLFPTVFMCVFPCLLHFEVLKRTCSSRGRVDFVEIDLKNEIEIENNVVKSVFFFGKFCSQRKGSCFLCISDDN